MKHAALRWSLLLRLCLPFSLGVPVSLCLLLPAANLAAQKPGGVSKQDPRSKRRVKPMPVPGTVALRLEKGKRIVVDGSTSEWPHQTQELAVNLVETLQVSGTAMGAYDAKKQQRDISGRGYLLWDDERLYVAAKVLDDWHRPLSAGRQRHEIPPADSLVLTIDPDRNTRSLGADEGRREDAEFWLGDARGRGRALVSWDRFRGTARYAKDALLVVQRNEELKVTTYEASIPWAEILPKGRKPKVGMTLDLQAVLNDFDEPTDPMPQTRVGWTFGTGPSIDPGIMGTVMLVDKFDKNSPPKMPKARQLSGEPVPGQGHWIRFLSRLKKTPPAWVDKNTVDVPGAGGMERLKILQELEHTISGFPRVDFLEFQYRIHRRMSREADGIAQTGLPYFWSYALKDVNRRMVASPGTRIRIFRLPQGGWFVRSDEVSFAIDPAGWMVDKLIGPGTDFVLLTRPLDLVKRNDQMLLRVAAAKRVIYAHLPYHLPGVDAAKMPLVHPGRHYRVGGTPKPGDQKAIQNPVVMTIFTVGAKTREGFTSPSIGYQLKWNDGTTMLIPGVSVAPGELRSLKKPDVLLLSALHPQAAAVAKQVEARDTILDEALEASAAQGSQGRATLTQAHKLQEQIKPLRSILLAPGESVDIKRATARKK